MRAPFALLTLGGLLLPSSPARLVAQAVPARSLTTPEAEFAESFDQILSLRELPNGKVLVTDLGPKAVLLADFARGTQAPVGRNGQGPGEYQFPGELLPLPGDSTLVADRAGRRLLAIGPDGKIGKTIPFPDALAGFPEAHGTDRQGRVYLTGSLMGAPGPGAPTLPDSLTLYRWNLATGAVEPVGRIKAPPMKMQVSGTANSRSVMMRSQPYAAQDDWAVSPEGRVAIASAADYHVEWLGGGAPVRGAPVRYEPVKVTGADRQAFLAGIKSSKNRMMISVGGGGGGGGSVSRNNTPPEAQESDYDWPEVKAPFVARTALISPEGDLWLQRYTPARDSTPTYDLFDGRGALTGRVTLPRGRKLVGLGRGTLYAVRTDDDGLQWLERYRR